MRVKFGHGYEALRQRDIRRLRDTCQWVFPVFILAITSYLQFHHSKPREVEKCQT